MTAGKRRIGLILVIAKPCYPNFKRIATEILVQSPQNHYSWDWEKRSQNLRRTGLFTTYLTLKRIRFLGCLLFYPIYLWVRFALPLHSVFISPSYSLFFLPNCKEDKKCRTRIEAGGGPRTGRRGSWATRRMDAGVEPRDASWGEGGRPKQKAKARGRARASGGAHAHAAVMFKQCSCPST